VLDDFAPARTNYPLAIRLHGKFKTAFPEGKPADAKDKDADKKADKPSGDFLKESKSDGVVYLFGDADFLYDPWCAEVNPILRVATPRNGNLALVQNLV
jgi:hypothetical protein